MKATIRRVAVFLTCVGVASSAAAQDTNRNQDSSTNGERQAERVLRQREIDAAGRAKTQTAQRRSTARGRGQGEISEGFSQTVRLAPGGTFDLLNFAGDVTVNGGGGREARIEAVKRVRAIASPQARTAISQVRIDVAERGGNVEVRTIQPRGAGRGVTVDYTVTLPENVNLILRSTSGNLNVLGMAGDGLSAETLSGNVVVRELRSRMLELHTNTGNIQLHDILTQRAQLQSIAGNLEYIGRLLSAGRYRFQTHRGDIRVVPSGDPGFDLEAMTYSGELHSDFALNVLVPPSERPGRRTQRVLRGKYGNAGAMVNASTFSGNVLIVKPD